MPTETPSQDCPQCGRFVQDRPNVGLRCPCGWKKLRGGGLAWVFDIDAQWGTAGNGIDDLEIADGISEANWEWATKVAALMRDTRSPGFDPASPRPEFHSPDALHDCQRQQRRTTTAAHNGMSPQRFNRLWGAYGIEQGDTVVYNNRLWTVRQTARWPAGNGHTVELAAVDGERRIAAVFPYSYGTTIGLVNGSHYPTCNDCGELWPCSEARESDDAAQQAERAVAQIEDEAQNPHGCQHCARRFTSKGGCTNHERYCRENPDRVEHPSRGRKRGSRFGYRVDHRGYVTFDD